jgi:hypothetical protein
LSDVGTHQLRADRGPYAPLARLGIDLAARKIRGDL